MAKTLTKLHLWKVVIDKIQITCTVIKWIKRDKNNNNYKKDKYRKRRKNRHRVGLDCQCQILNLFVIIIRLLKIGLRKLYPTA